MNGIELIEVIAARWPRLPVVLATGYAEFGSDVEITVPKLDKPFTGARLAEVIAEATGRRRPGRVLNFPKRNGASKP